MTRIVAGALGGRRIATPPGLQTRPTSDRVREALFSTLEALTELAGCRFADLYAGSGAVGLEAASRGAAEVLLVESDARAARTIKENVALLGLGSRCQVRTGRAEAAAAAGGSFDVVYADPPYALDDATLASLLSLMVDSGFLAGDGIVVVERSTRSREPAWPGKITPERSKRYGETLLWYGRAVPHDPGPTDPPSLTEPGGMR